MTRATYRTRDWTTFGRDLLLSVSGVPRGRWASHMCEELRAAIRNGTLQAGMRLPSTRALAADLGVSRGLAVAVYEQLTAEGYLDTRRGSGTTVARVTVPPHSTNVADGSLYLSAVRPNPGLPDMGLFPRRAWLKAYTNALQTLPDADLRYGDPQGFEPLREELAGYLGRVRGIRATADHIVIVNGFAQGLAVLARILPARGITSVAVEEPGSRGTREQLQAWGMATPPAVVDEHGLDISALERSGAEAVLVTPAHHYPTGVVLAPERRHRLLEWVRAASGRYIIEDDYDAEFRYDSAPIGSLQPLDPERIITGSSVSKTLSPAMRLGWMVMPESLVGDAIRAKAAFDLGNHVLGQAAFVELLRTGGFDRHVRASRIDYRRRRRNLAAQLVTASPRLEASGLDAGLSICISVDLDDDRALAAKLKSSGVRCEALSYYQQSSRPKTGIVIDLVATTEQHMATVIAAIEQAR